MALVSCRFLHGFPELRRLSLPFSDLRSVGSPCARNEHVSRDWGFFNFIPNALWPGFNISFAPSWDFYRFYPPGVQLSLVFSGPRPVAGNVRSGLMTLRQPQHMPEPWGQCYS